MVGRSCVLVEEVREEMGGSYKGHGSGVKASFDHIYDLEDPRGYFNTLDELDYQAPEHGSRIFHALLEKKEFNGPRAKVVDLCCSYGVNAALLKHDLSLGDLYSRYGSEQLADLSADELATADGAFFENHRLQSPPEVVGVDAAKNAVSYALRAGLLDAGFAENLEEEDPSDALREAVSGADLLTVTGGVGYVWENTFERLLSCFGREDMPWVATLPLRMVDYAPIAEVLSGHELTTEKLTTRTFRQRRFAGDSEREHVLRQLAKAGIDPGNKEETGWYHSEFYLSRPAEEAERVPLRALAGAVETP